MKKIMYNPFSPAIQSQAAVGTSEKNAKRVFALGDEKVEKTEILAGNVCKERQ